MIIDGQRCAEKDGNWKKVKIKITETQKTRQTLRSRDGHDEIGKGEKAVLLRRAERSDLDPSVIRIA